MADERTEKQKVQEITDKLEEGLKELFESEKYKTYLSTMSKFHNYSFNNTLLIAMQKPEATLVAGYKAWQKNFERHVNKGEKAIRILAPAPYKIKEERDKLDPVTGEMMFDENGMPQKEQVEVTIPAFRAVSVFDVSQTDGKPIPELEAQELLSTVEGYENFVQALMNVAPVPIGFEDIPGDSKGYFHTEEKRIAVQENMSESQTLKTMVHEVAHSMLHNKEKLQGMVLGGAFGAAFANPMPSLFPTDLLVGIAVGGALRLAVYLKGKNAKKYRHNAEYGSARWGTHEDIEPFEDKDFANNVLLSQTERLTMSGRPSQPKYARNKNVLVVGGSGSGKTRFFIKPNLLQMHSSYVVTDPKGLVFRGQSN